MSGNLLPGGIIKLSFDGSDLSLADTATVTSAVIEQQLNLPAVCRVVMAPIDYDRSSSAVMNFDTFDLGISMVASIGLDRPTRLFGGTICALEPNLTTGCREIEITGYDALFSLDFGNKARSFENRSDSQIVTQVIEDAGFEPDVDDTAAVYPYVLQDNMSDYAFLLSRAKRLTYEVSASGHLISFRPSRAGGKPVVSLEYGVGLSEFQARVRVLKKGDSVTRLGWDPSTKQVITATVDSGATRDRMGGSETGYAISAVAGSSAVTGPGIGISDTEIAEALAKAAYEDGLDDFLDGTAECAGNPAIVVGINVTLSNIGKRFDGLYYVIGARHSYDRDSGYRTRFAVRRTGI